MMQFWMKLKPQERRALASAAVCIGCWLAVTWLVQPLWDHMQELHERIARDTRRLEAVSRLFTQAPGITQRYGELASQLAPGASAGGREATLLESVQETCSRLNLQPSLKPRVAKIAGEPDRLEVELGVEGPQEQILSLLDALLQLPRLMMIQELRILSVASRASTLRATIVLQDLPGHP